ncbi:unnamed protein product, partial [Mesorhabditis belari]|uniref:HMG box domain-containing protein n=1 Tax=Mesorhabditis belari TaxID=2138241 RepID=A0AAF3F9V3_9BILA
MGKHDGSWTSHWIEKQGGSGEENRWKEDERSECPKAAMSAFFFWLRENRARIKKDGMGVADVAKAAGEEWRVLKDKSKWEKLADKDKQRYESDMAVYKKK